jgi:hypothetical protein
MSCRKFLVANLLVILILSSAISGSSFTIAQIDAAIIKLEAASSTVGLAFKAVLSAENAGANVTGLLEQLTVATGLLAQAENSYRTGDKSAASNYAVQVIPIAQQVAGQATTAEKSATAANQHAFEFTIASVVIGSFLFVLSLFLVWRYFKGRYINKMLEAKPEVTNN